MAEARRVRAGLPANILKRGLTAEQTAEYCGCETLEALATWVKRGIIPPPIPGTHRYDRKAIDAWLDRASGLAKDSPTVSSFDNWAARHES